MTTTDTTTTTTTEHDGTQQDHAGYWALLDTRVSGNRCRIYATEAEATEALEATVTATREHAERQVQHAVEDARNKLVVVHREWGEQPNAPISRHG